MCKRVRDADRLESLKPHYTENDISTEVDVAEGIVDLKCTRFNTRIRMPSGHQVRPFLHAPPVFRLIDLSAASQHIRFETDQGRFKGYVKEVSGKSIKVTPKTTFSETAKILSVATVGKEGLSQPEVIRASLVLSAFKGADTLLSSPFVRKIFFPDYPLSTLKWPEVPTTQPNVNFTHRELNEAQKKAVEKCLSNKEEDRHVVIVVSSISQFPCLPSR